MITKIYNGLMVMVFPFHQTKIFCVLSSLISMPQITDIPVIILVLFSTKMPKIPRLIYGQLSLHFPKEP